MKQCIGCGAILQCENEKEIGYVDDLSMDYCRRCFKMIHYDQHSETDFVPDNEQIIRQLSELTGQYIWIMDIIDLDSSLHSVFAQFFKEKHCTIILNKCDLLPRNTNFDALSEYVLKRISVMAINVHCILTRGVNPDFVEQFQSHVNLDEPLIMCGLSNVGKSTVINHLLNKAQVTVNRYPATTININEICSDLYHFYDTVGIVNYQSVHPYLDNKNLKMVMISRQLKPQLFQIYENQSFAIGGLVRLDIAVNHRATLIFYNSPLLTVHRGKKENAEGYWKRHFNEELKPTIGSDVSTMKRIHFVHKGKCEYFICGLGFIQIHSPDATIDLYVERNIEITKRECIL